LGFLPRGRPPFGEPLRPNIIIGLRKGGPRGLPKGRLIIIIPKEGNWIGFLKIPKEGLIF